MKKARKHIPKQETSKIINRLNFTYLIALVTLISVMVFLIGYNYFGVEDKYYSNYIKFQNFVEKNGTIEAKLKIFVNETKECVVKAVYGNQTDMESFILNKGTQVVYLPLRNMPFGNTRVEFFLNCSPQIGGDVNGTIQTD
jgi:hypothetical protein